MLIGVISDTHGYSDPRLSVLFGGVQYIIHAGDVGSPAVLDSLREIAPVLAVRGNVDQDPRLLSLPDRLDICLDGIQILVVHRLQDLEPDPHAQVVISGHSHRPLAEWRGPILYLNPGAAGRQGFHRERTASLLRLSVPPSSTPLSLGPKSLRMGSEQSRPLGRRSP